jgi:3-deoxy-7-phosphoheptulonate synthase
VTSWEILRSSGNWPRPQEGKRFLLQGGDCAESFGDCSSAHLQPAQGAAADEPGAGARPALPVVRVGRFAGQYAKPRSADCETRDGITLPSYRGDLVNGPEFTPAARARSARMVEGHARSAMTMNFVRALIDGGFADLHHPEYWDLGWVGTRRWRRVPRDGRQRSATRCASWRPRRGADPQPQPGRLLHFARGLAAAYEEALTRQVPRQWGWFNLHPLSRGSACAPRPGGAHVEYFRGIRNPIGGEGRSVGDAGPAAAPDRRAESRDEPGRLTLIHRMGAAKDRRPAAAAARGGAQRRAPRAVVCDPMHGNTEAHGNGYKTRRFENIRSELEQAFDLHAAAGTRLGGVHLELTGEDVTECLGGARDLTEQDLSRAYRSTVDPRLNYEQALERRC